ncbi:RNA ligase/cyclic nucleotide phosphodiesterase [Aspergillus germanicus]
MAPSSDVVDNPFQILVDKANNDPTELQRLYETHRTNRNNQQRGKILSETFPGWSIDDILARLDGPSKEAGFVDPRNCLVIWARPPPAVREVIRFVQDELKSVAPELWLMPLENLHTTVLEVAHSRTEEEIEDLVKTLQSSTEVTSSQIASYPISHQSRLVKPMVSFDSAALALSFAPAAGEGASTGETDEYSYHNLRGDIWDLVRRAGLPVASRYVVPSAHLTIARFISQGGFAVGDEVDRARVKSFVDKIEEINRRLEAEYWPRSDGAVPAGGEWDVGREGLVLRRGRVWYGGGEDVPLD